MESTPWQDFPSLESSVFTQPEADPELVDPDMKYFCPIHGGLLREPIQTLCGHRMCRSCLFQYLDGEVSRLCPVEDEDRELISVDNVFPDPGIVREIKVLDVYCPNKMNGCKDVMKYKEVANHAKECPFRPASCQYAYRGCREPMMVYLLSQHEANCGYQPVSCEQCGQEINLANREDHLNNLCPETVIQCLYNCGQKIKRKQMEDHSIVCPLKPKECHYKVLGCGFVGSEHVVSKHEKDWKSHFEILVAAVCDMMVSIRRLPASDIQVFSALRDRMSIVEATFPKQTSEWQDKHGMQGDKVVALEKTVEEIKNEQSRLLADIRDLKNSVDQLNEDIKKSQERTSDSFFTNLRTLEIRLAENDLRFQMVETTSHNGILLWKIRDFATRRQDAIHGRTVSLYSQPFFSSPYGYKMCVRAYLNGDGVGKNTHLSLYFVVMRGEYDSLLQWPFQLEITLIVLDQSPQKRHIKDSFNPDPTSTSFQRPRRAEMNVASGCPLFMAHTIIDNPNNKYVQDDVMFIKVSVDGSHLPPT